MLIVFDDVQQFREAYKKTLPKMEVDLEVIECVTKEELRSRLTDEQLMRTAKVIVFDLSSTKEEEETLKFDILEDIGKNYKTYPIPIFIHSAFADQVEGYDNLGTVFKVKKSASSVQEILEKIKLFYDSGFLDIFCPDGSIERELHHQIHKSFIEQFKGDEIKQILESIQKTHQSDFKERTHNVFERIAVRALFQNLLSAKKHPESGSVEEVKVNAVEHYYRRSREFAFWTGDIFESEKDESNVIVLTPRCNISNGKFEELLLCKIKPLEGELFSTFKKEKNLIKGLTDDVTLMHIAERFRFLAKTPQFEGGIVDFNSSFTLNPADFMEIYSYKISLVDDLVNDIVRKFTSYILRGGVSVTEVKEASYYFE